LTIPHRVDAALAVLARKSATQLIGCHCHARYKNRLCVRLKMLHDEKRLYGRLKKLHAAKNDYATG